jgi:hypothetical protein
VLEIERAEDRLDDRGHDVRVLCELLQLVVRDRPAPELEKPLAESEPPADDRAALARDDVRPDLCQVTFLVVGKALVELPRNGEAENAVPQELEPLVGLGAVVRPGRVREGVA